MNPLFDVPEELERAYHEWEEEKRRRKASLSYADWFQMLLSPALERLFCERSLPMYITEWRWSCWYLVAVFLLLVIPNDIWLGSPALLVFFHFVVLSVMVAYIMATYTKYAVYVLRFGLVVVNLFVLGGCLYLSFKIPPSRQPGMVMWLMIQMVANLYFFSFSITTSCFANAILTVGLGTYLMVGKPAGIPPALGLDMMFVVVILNAALVFFTSRSFLAIRAHFAEQVVSMIQDHHFVSEQGRLNDILNVILPAKIAQRVKAGELPVADLLEDTTVLFAILPDFFKIMAEAGLSSRVVELLNTIYCEFDEAAESQGILRVKITGDVYMAVCGAPEAVEDHAVRAARFAIAIKTIVHHCCLRWKHRLGVAVPLTVQVGLNSGPVVAGVCGLKKFCYDVWGDTVNTASRMASHAPRGGVLVTAETAEMLGALFTVVAQPTISVKGKGDMKAYQILDYATASLRPMYLVPKESAKEVEKVSPTSSLRDIWSGNDSATDVAGSAQEEDTSSLDSEHVVELEFPMGNEEPVCDTEDGMFMLTETIREGMLTTAEAMEREQARSLTRKKWKEDEKRPSVIFDKITRGKKMTSSETAESQARTGESVRTSSAHHLHRLSFASSGGDVAEMIRRNSMQSVILSNTRDVCFDSFQSSATQKSSIQKDSDTDEELDAVGELKLSDATDAKFTFFKRRNLQASGNPPPVDTKKKRRKSFLGHFLSTSTTYASRSAHHSVPDIAMEYGLQPQNLMSEEGSKTETMSCLLGVCERFEDAEIEANFQREDRVMNASMCTTTYFLNGIVTVALGIMDIVAWTYRSQSLGTAKKAEELSWLPESVVAALAVRMGLGIVIFAIAFYSCTFRFLELVTARRHVDTVCSLVVFNCAILAELVASLLSLPRSTPYLGHRMITSVTLAFCIPSVSSLTAAGWIFPYVAATGVVVHLSALPGALSTVVDFILLCIGCLTWKTKLRRYHRVVYKERLRMASRSDAITASSLKADVMLRNVFPDSICTRLKAGEVNVTTFMPKISVLYTDIVGFTAMSNGMSPVHVIDMVNRIFCAFDKVCDRHGLEKIKTIGDCFVCTSELPKDNGKVSLDSHEKLALGALEMMEVVQQLNVIHDTAIKMRCGIHCGAVVGGILGNRRYVFDILGDTVKRANELESASLPERVLVSSEMRDAIRGNPHFVFQQKGTTGGEYPSPTFLLDVAA